MKERGLYSTPTSNFFCQQFFQRKFILRSRELIHFVYDVFSLSLSLSHARTHAISLSISEDVKLMNYSFRVFFNQTNECLALSWQKAHFQRIPK